YLVGEHVQNLGDMRPNPRRDPNRIQSRWDDQWRPDPFPLNRPFPAWHKDWAPLTTRPAPCGWATTPHLRHRPRPAASITSPTPTPATRSTTTPESTRREDQPVIRTV